MKHKILLLILSTCWTLKKNAQVTEETKFGMFCAALKNQSTAPNYVVVTIKNLNTGKKKEVCTEAPFLNGAIDRQTGKATSTLDCTKLTNRYFEFSKKSALENIDFDYYTIEELNAFEKTIDLERTIQQVKSGKLTTKIFNGDKKEQVMFAHLMFNNGVMMTRGCVAGNICELSYFK